ncbi:MAG TPA: HAD family hydrolase [Vicinamibacterales bacterium]|nr:HAD family hydrolase [Vicinamibacterales bacterium]
MNRAVFVDRDGTMMEDAGYLDRMERLKLFPYTVDAIRLLNRAGLKVVVVTSQAGVAHGIVTEEFLAQAHEFIGRRVADAGGRIDAFYYCPHLPTAAVEKYRTDCDCRKPKPGMIHSAARDLSIDLSGSYVVGDRWRDIEMGQAAGVEGVLVETGYGKSEASRRPENIKPVTVVANLIEATTWILRNM